MSDGFTTYRNNCKIKVMLKNYFKIAWRSLSKASSFINISGLAVGMAVAMSSALVITIITVSFQSIKAALTNPVKSLRTE